MVYDVSALTTDFYELTMMQGYYLNNENPDVVFDMFYRKNPFDGGYAIFAGLSEMWLHISFAFNRTSEVHLYIQNMVS